MIFYEYPCYMRNELTGVHNFFVISATFDGHVYNTYLSHAKHLHTHKINTCSTIKVKDVDTVVLYSESIKIKMLSATSRSDC